MLEVDSKTRIVSATISENVIEEVDKLLKYYEEEGFKVTRSSFIQSALKAYVKFIKQKIEKEGKGV